MNSYSFLAKYYDLLMQDFNYGEYIEFLINTLRGSTGVDLACGSGKVTLALAKNNFKVMGVDISAEMLNTARENARGEGKNLTFIQADMVDFSPMGKVDFYVCVCDGLNYVPKNKLPNLFKNTFQNLRDGGCFIFDISSEYKLRDILGDELFFEDGDNLTYFWQNEYNKDKQCVDMSLVFFEKEGEKYSRFDEEHRQFIHKTDFLCNELEKVGFLVKVLDGENFENISTTSKRCVFVCKKEI